jgi:hypothetical protein
MALLCCKENALLSCGENVQNRSHLCYVLSVIIRLSEFAACSSASAALTACCCR